MLRWAHVIGPGYAGHRPGDLPCAVTTLDRFRDVEVVFQPPLAGQSRRGFATSVATHYAAVSHREPPSGWLQGRSRPHRARNVNPVREPADHLDHEEEEGTDWSGRSGHDEENPSSVRATAQRQHHVGPQLDLPACEWTDHRRRAGRKNGFRKQDMANSPFGLHPKNRRSSESSPNP